MDIDLFKRENIFTTFKVLEDDNEELRFIHHDFQDNFILDHRILIHKMK